MTRYEAALLALSAWLAKARAPIEDETAREPARAPNLPPAPQAKNSVARHTRKLMLPPSWERRDASRNRSPVIQLWRAIGGSGRHGIHSHK
jgi:hypothetical protein